MRMTLEEFFAQPVSYTHLQPVTELQGQAVGIDMGDIGYAQADGRGQAVGMVLKMQDCHRGMVQVKAGPEQHLSLIHISS